MTTMLDRDEERSDEVNHPIPYEKEMIAWADASPHEAAPWVHMLLIMFYEVATRNSNLDEFARDRARWQADRFWDEIEIPGTDCSLPYEQLRERRIRWTTAASQKWKSFMATAGDVPVWLMLEEMRERGIWSPPEATTERRGEAS
jgi:hypothetical protein